MTSQRDRVQQLVSADNLDPLETMTRLRREGESSERAQALTEIASGTRVARKAGQPTGSMWTRAAAEQASDPLVSAWRARRYHGNEVTDVTAGCGGDAMALVSAAATLVAVEVNPVRVELLRSNVPPEAVVIEGDCLSGSVQPATWWADPSRRVDGRRVKRLGEVIPSVPALVQRFGAGAAGVAISPGIDLADPAIPVGAEIEFIQVGARLVEGVLWLGELRGFDGGGERRSATLLPGGHHERGTPASEHLAVAPIGAYLLEPAPALVRARLHEIVGARHGAWRVAQNRAMLSADAPPASPWFTCWEVDAVVSARIRKVSAALRGLGDELPLEIASHGIDADVERWHRELGTPRGPNGRRLHLLRVDRGGIGVLTRQVPGPLTGSR